MTRAVLILLGLLLSAQACSSEPTEGPVRVDFENPGSFTDARTDRSHAQGTSESVILGLTRYLQRTAPGHLGPDQHLQVTFTDVDLAGDYEPGTNLSLYDVRVVKPIYPPRLKFRWSLVDGSGAVLREGEEDLRDLGFQMHARLNERDPLRFEKRILKRWLHDTLPRSG